MKEEINDIIFLKVDDNLTNIKNVFKDNSDIVYREFYIGKYKAVFIYIDGLGDKVLLDDYVLQSAMIYGNNVEDVTEIKDRLLTVSDIKEEKELSKAIDLLLSGDTIMFIDGIDLCYVISTRLWPSRGVGEPASETVIRGARDGFTETIRFNTALIRRRIKDTRLKFIPKTFGVRSKTDSVIVYIDDIVNRDILNELTIRLEKIHIDAIMDTGYIEQMIEDNKYSPFPQVQVTERPDVVAAALYEGRIAILADNSPNAIIVPATLPTLCQSPDDYYQRWVYSSLIRLIRFLAIIVSLIMPALYVAVTSFHTSIIPTKLAYSIAASREGVPFPAFVEAIIMEISIAFLTEATVRLPKPIGSTIGIVGGLIIGQAAVSAGIVSQIMIIIVSITILASFATPNYEVNSAIRFIRFMLIIAASIVGLYGIAFGLIILLIHLIRLKSFGIPYLSPIVNPSMEDQKDVFVRMPFEFFKKRPEFMNTGDKIRQK